MIEDLEGQEGVQWAVEWDLAEGEELPKDVEDLSMAQYTIWKFLAVLNGFVDDDEKAMELLRTSIKEEPSRVLVPKKLDS